MLGAVSTASLALVALVTAGERFAPFGERSSAAGEPQKPKVEICPWCKNDPALMKKAGIVSHGPIPIGPRGSQAIEASLPAGQWVFLETAHLRWGSSLPAVTVDLEDKKRVVAEVARLHELLPAVPLEPKKLDPFLRLHLFAMKGEELYAHFEKILDVTDEDFPETRTQNAPFMGAGRYLGEKDKYEIVIHSVAANHRAFTKDFCGSEVTSSLRYHFPDLHKIILSVPAVDPDMKKDRWLYPYIVHNLTHMMFCGYKHFSYDPPAWIDEGLACALEKEIEPQSTTNEGEEGSMSDLKGPKDWSAAVKRLIAMGKQKSTADLMHVKRVDGFDLDGKMTCWSMMRFLIDTEPAPLAKLLGAVKGQLDDKGYPTGKDLPDLTRRSMKDLMNWTPAAFDEAWKAWAVK
jgi:hypothetical protein